MLSVIAMLALGCTLAVAQPAEDDPHRMEITLERQHDGEWQVIDPGLVLENGDRVRFRFHSNFDGYLYVMNQGTSGKHELLFPREETGEQNRIEAGKEYQIPATQAWFRIDGPPGFDIVYWLVTPLKLGGGARPYVPLPPPPEKLPPPENLLPRCDDSIFRARGLCVDSNAGPRNVREQERLPENLAAVPGMRSRELVIMRKKESALISSPASTQSPLLYEFRLAHK